MNEYLNETTNNFDLIFIDGNDRVKCLNDSINRSPIIVCHDTHQGVMGWSNSKIPNYYKQLTYKGCLPYLTTIFYHQDINLKNILFDPIHFEHKGTFIDHNFWDELDIVEHYKSI